MKQYLAFILSILIPFYGWSMDQANNNRSNQSPQQRSKHLAPSSARKRRASIASLPKAFSTLRKSFDNRRSSMELSSSPHSRSAGSMPPQERPITLYQLYENNRKKLTPTNGYLGEDDTLSPEISERITSTITNKKNYAAWKLYAHYLDEHFAGSQQSYSATVRDNAELLKEMSMAFNEQTEAKSDWLKLCSQQFQKTWSLIDQIEELIQARNEEISTNTLQRDSSQKSLFIDVYFCISEPLKSLLSKIRNGNQNYSSNNLFQMYRLEHDVFRCERQKSDLEKQQRTLLSNRAAAQKSFKPQSDIDALTRKISTLDAQIAQYKKKTSNLETEYEALKRTLHLLNSTKSSSTSSKS